jgi:hypothetical protein
MRTHRFLLATALLLAAAPLGVARAATCDAATIANLRDATSSCDCAGAASHGAYVKCVVEAVKAAGKSSGASKVCERAVRKCAVKSTCGKAGAVACVETSATGATKCVLKKDSTACKAPKGGSACAASEPSCCDATCGG